MLWPSSATRCPRRHMRAAQVYGESTEKIGQAVRRAGADQAGSRPECPHVLSRGGRQRFEGAWAVPAGRVRQ